MSWLARAARLLPLVLLALAIPAPSSAIPEPAQYGGTFGPRQPGYQQPTTAAPRALSTIGLKQHLTGASVSGGTWNDLSGNGNTCSFTGGTGPCDGTVGSTTVNGLPAPTFNGSSQCAYCGTIASVVSGSAFSMYAVVVPYNWSAGATYLLPALFEDAGEQIGLGFSSSLGAIAYVDESPHYTSAAVTLGTAYTLYVHWNSTAASICISVNGGAENCSPTAGTITSTGLRISMSYSPGSGQFLHSTIPDFALYNIDTGPIAGAVPTQNLAYERALYATW